MHSKDMKVLEARAAVRHTTDEGALFGLIWGETRSSVRDEAARKYRLMSVTAGVPITGERAAIVVQVAAEAAEPPAPVVVAEAPVPADSFTTKPPAEAEPTFDTSAPDAGASFGTNTPEVVPAEISASDAENIALPVEGAPPTPAPVEEDSPFGDASPFGAASESDPKPASPAALRACPRCKVEKAPEMFGIRMMGGKPRPQSYCKACRSEHAKFFREKERAALVEAGA